MTGLHIKTDDRKYGDRLRTFRVRASVEFSFGLEVDAHDVREAELVTENFCEAMGGSRWQELAEHVHKSVEVERQPVKVGRAGHAR